MSSVFDHSRSRRSPSLKPTSIEFQRQVLRAVLGDRREHQVRVRRPAVERVERLRKVEPVGRVTRGLQRGRRRARIDAEDLRRVADRLERLQQAGAGVGRVDVDDVGLALDRRRGDRRQVGGVGRHRDRLDLDAGLLERGGDHAQAGELALGVVGVEDRRLLGAEVLGRVGGGGGVVADADRWTLYRVGRVALDRRERDAADVGEVRALVDGEGARGAGVGATEDRERLLVHDLPGAAR